MSWLRGVVSDVRWVFHLASIVGWKSVDVLEVWRGCRLARRVAAVQRSRIARVLQ